MVGFFFFFFLGIHVTETCGVCMKQAYQEWMEFQFTSLHHFSKCFHGAPLHVLQMHLRKDMQNGDSGLDYYMHSTGFISQFH